jgi:hypothetical protein
MPGDSFVDDTTCGATDDNVDIELVPASVTNLTNGEDAMVGRMEEIIQFFLNLLKVPGGRPGSGKMRMVPYSFQMEGKGSIINSPKGNTHMNQTRLQANRNMHNHQMQGTIGEPHDTRIPPQWGRYIHRIQTSHD